MKYGFRQQWILLLAIMALGLAVGALLGCYLFPFAPPETIPVDTRPDFQLMAEAWNTIEKVYVDRAAVKPQRMTYGAISGMVDALGETRHSRFLTPCGGQVAGLLLAGALSQVHLHRGLLAAAGLTLLAALLGWLPTSIPPNLRVPRPVLAYPGRHSERIVGPPPVLEWGRIMET